MANERVNKVVLGNEVLIDITDSTVNPNVLLAGYKAYDASGNAITGEFSPSYHITLTQAQYDQVSQQEKMADENFFYITDATVVGTDIDDTTTSTTKVWSSSKVNSELGNKANSADVPTKAQISNPNLLTNPWFTVNQRGITSGWTTRYAYGVDRWKKESDATNTLSVGSNGITANNGNVRIFQTFLYEDIDDLFGKTITMSALVDGNIYSGSGTIPLSWKTDGKAHNIKVWDNGSGSDLTLYFLTTGRMTFQVDMNGVTTGVRAAKLELGSISTLALDTAPNYATELLKCQRYFVRLATTNAFMGYMHLSSVARIILPTPVTMRTRPTWTPSDVTGLQIVSGTTTQTLSNSQALSWAGFTPQEFVIAISDLTSPFTSGEFCMMKLNTSYIDLSADL